MIVRLWAIALLLLAALTPSAAGAMDFRLLQTGKHQRAVLAKGVIEPGDAVLLSAALDLATRDRTGTKRLLLDSPGGVVAEAFAMADVMDRVGVTTVVPAKALCGSACASVLFVSGKYRVVEKGGELAVHSCYDARNGRQMEDCNAVIAAHAQYEGSSGVAMMALQQAAGPRAAFVFDNASAACFGLTRAPGRRASAPCLEAAMRAAHRRR
jgi:hypothetical protein